MSKEMTNGNYLSKAEDDRISFEILRKSGSPHNVMGRLAQQVCEKQLKHLICLGEGITAEDLYKIPNIPEYKKHDLVYLAKRASDDGMIQVSTTFSERMRKLSRFLTDTIYPDSRYSHDMTGRDIVFCMDCIDHCSHITAKALKAYDERQEAKLQAMAEFEKHIEKTPVDEDVFDMDYDDREDL